MIRFLLLVALAATALGQAYEAKAKPMNVLFIAVDDLRPELGCYGVDYAPSPNIDRLAERGMVFRNHFVQVPTCGASRYAMLTGRSPAVTGYTGGNAGFYTGKTALSAETLPGAQSMPELFKRSGYQTVLIGKISHTADGRVYAYNGAGDGRDEVPNAWTEMSTPYGTWKRGWGIFFAYANGIHREDGSGAKDLVDFTVKNDDDLPDGQIASHAVDRLQHLAERDKPFFMGLGFFKPHLPFVAPKQDWDALKAADIPPPPYPDKINSHYWHSSGEFFKYNFPFPKRPLTQENVINARRAYLACVRYTDRQVGRVLDVLDETGLSENTIVVLWGDHGWNLGDSALWAKHTPLERAVRSPLIISMPGMKQSGSSCDALVESLDLFPTIIDLTKPVFKKTKHQLDGKSLAKVLDDPSAKVRDAALSYWRDSITVRTQSHRLIVTRKNDQIIKVELYDQSTHFDPVENKADTNPKVVERLKAYLP
ncbi:MAG: sulfatase [Verrucomicrobiota bacterium]|nr:sulfatase [Verrucomicrobiota bacterium]